MLALAGGYSFRRASDARAAAEMRRDARAPRFKA